MPKNFAKKYRKIKMLNDNNVENEKSKDENVEHRNVEK